MCVGISSYISTSELSIVVLLTCFSLSFVRVCVCLVSAVHVVLVTDLLVLLTERDQKFHLATLQDLKVRVDRSVGSL